MIGVAEFTLLIRENACLFPFRNSVALFDSISDNELCRCWLLIFSKFVIHLSFAAKRIAAAYSIMAYPKQFSYCKSNSGILLYGVLLQVSPVRIWGKAFCRVSNRYNCKTAHTEILFNPFSNHLSSCLIPSSYKRTLYCLAEWVWKKHDSDNIFLFHVPSGWNFFYLYGLYSHRGSV